jgi:hypothetical protein
MRHRHPFHLQLLDDIVHLRQLFPYRLACDKSSRLFALFVPAFDTLKPGHCLHITPEPSTVWRFTILPRDHGSHNLAFTLSIQGP